MVNFFIQLIIFKRIPKILLEMGGRHPYARTSIHSSFSFKGNSKHLVTILFPKFNLSLINIRDCVRLCVGEGRSSNKFFILNQLSSRQGGSPPPHNNSNHRYHQ